MTAPTVEQESRHLRQELGLTDLVLTQILYVVGLSWVGTAAKLGTAQIPFWLAAMAMFYLPQAAVVVHLSRRFPLEGGLYQWAKLGLNEAMAFLVGWNLWIYAIVLLGSFGLSVANALVYAIGPRAQALSGNHEIGKVSYGTEGSQFQRAGISTVVCGPGSIEQAHKPNEFVALEQVAQCEAFLRGLMARICEK